MEQAIWEERIRRSSFIIWNANNTLLTVIKMIYYKFEEKKKQWTYKMLDEL